MENSKKRFLPFRDGVALSRFMYHRTQKERENMRWIPYASAIRKSHVILCTQPDICFAFGIVSRYQLDSCPIKWTVVKHVIKYLKGTRDYMLVSRERGSSTIWSEHDLSRFMSSCVFYLGGDAVN
jgi:hypothetical protein